jgi:hypothetical protein
LFDWVTGKVQTTLPVLVLQSEWRAGWLFEFLSFAGAAPMAALNSGERRSYCPPNPAKACGKRETREIVIIFDDMLI